MTDETTEDDEVQCTHCGYKWEYTGAMEVPTCPSCIRKTAVGAEE